MSMNVDGLPSGLLNQEPHGLPDQESMWQQGQLIDLTINDLSDRGDGVGRWQDRVVFVPNAVPGDRLQVRLTQVKPAYGFGQLITVLTASADRVRPACIVADKCGGCQWQAVAYSAQLAAKHGQVVEAMRRIAGFANFEVDPVLAAEQSLGYRNKVTYPLSRSLQGQVKAGYYRKGSHQIVNLNQCPIQDERLDPLLMGVKQSIQTRGWSIYDEKKHRGRLRHLSLRVGRSSGECLITLVSTEPLGDLAEQAQQWLVDYPNVVGVCLNINAAKTNAIFGEDTICVAGRGYLEEAFLGLTFYIQPTTFFQVNTEQAERLVQCILDQLALVGDEIVIDAYCGVGAMSLPLAQRASRCIGIESQVEAVSQARQNAEINGVENVEFHAGSVERLFPQIVQGLPVDVVVLDPPRRGCDPTVLSTLIALKPRQVAYMSCNPATLARDLQVLCGQGGYQLQRLQPADFFPQTAHVECVAFLVA